MTTGAGVSGKGAWAKAILCFTVLILAAGTASAQSRKMALTINVTPAGTGTVTGAGSYNWLQIVRIQATPKPGCTFTGWSGSLTSKSNPAYVWMTKSKTITATFADTAAPQITQCAADRTITLDAACTAVVPDFTAGVVATDNVTPAQNLIITQDPPAGTSVGLGATTVTISVKDAVNRTATCTATLTVDPAVPAATPSAPVVGNPTVETLDVTIAPDGNGADVEYALFCSTTGEWVLADGTRGAAPAWQTKDACGTVTVTDLDEYTQYAFNAVARNCEGTESAGPEASALTKDVTPPTGTIIINDNRSATNTYNVSIALTWNDGAGSGVVRMRFSNDGMNWSAWEPLKATLAYTLPGPDGHNTVRVQFLDKANNRSAVFADYIRVDSVPPTGGIIINDGAAKTTSHTVTLKLNYVDNVDGSGVTRMRFSDNGMNWTMWEALRTSRFYTLPDGLGYRTVRVQYRDGGGNVSPTYHDYIKVVE